MQRVEFGVIEDLVVTSNGSAASIYRSARTEGDGGIGEPQVRLSAGSVSRIIDRGYDIDPTSLELGRDGRSVTYLKAVGGELEQRSAPLR